MGGGGVGLIQCDLGCINGVDSSLHFFFFFFKEFCVDFGDFLKNSIGWWWRPVDCCCWWRVVLVYGGFHVIVGGGGVGLIPCDLGCINGVNSSLHFFLFFLELC